MRNRKIFLKYLICNKSLIKNDVIQQFTYEVAKKSTARSQARVISGIKAFYKYLLLENIVSDDPTTLLEGPKIGQKLPDFLTVEEINALIAA